MRSYRQFNQEPKGEPFEQMKARLALKTPEHMFQDFDYWQNEIFKADLDGDHYKIEMPYVERIVELNEKRF